MRWWGGRESHRREGGREHRPEGGREGGREGNTGQIEVGKLESRECVGCERLGSEGTGKGRKDPVEMDRLIESYGWASASQEATAELWEKRRILATGTDILEG